MTDRPRQNLYLEISRDLVTQELTDLRNYVSGAKILPAGFVEKANAQQICNQLEKEQKLKPGDLFLLVDLLRRIGRDDYAEKAQKIAENERKGLNEKPNSTTSQRHRQLSPTVSGPKEKVRRVSEGEPPTLRIVVRILKRVKPSVKTPEDALQWASAKKTLFTTDITGDDTCDILEQIESEIKTIPDLLTVVEVVKTLESIEGNKVTGIITGSLVFHLQCTKLDGLGELWFMYKCGELDKLMYSCLVSEETLQQLSADSITVKATIEAEEFRNALAYILSIPAVEGLDHTTSADNLQARPPPSTPVDHSDITGMDLAVVCRENQSCTGQTEDISTLSLTVRQVHKALQSCKEKKDVRLETIRGQVRTAREDTEAMVRSQTRAIIGLREKDEKAQKILLEQKMKISQLQESIKPREAEIEALTAENTKLSNQVADIPELRDEVRMFREKDETSQNVLSELRQEIQQLQEIIKTREARIEELTDENTKLSKPVAEGHDQLQRLREKEETPLKALSEQEQETQQLLETYKGNAAAQTEDQGSAKHTVEEKSQGEELMLEDTQSGAEDKANQQTTQPTLEQQQLTQGYLTFELALQRAQQDGQLPLWQGPPNGQQDFINQLIQNTPAKSEYNRLCKAQLGIQYAEEKPGDQHRLLAVYPPQVCMHHVTNIKFDTYKLKRKLQLKLKQQVAVRVVVQGYNSFLQYYRQHNNTLPKTSYQKLCADRDRYRQERDDARRERDQALQQRTRARQQTNQALEERNQARQERDETLNDWNHAMQQRAQALQERNQARQERDQTLHDWSLAIQQRNQNRVSADWKDLAWCLGFRRPDIDNIDTKHRDDKSRCMELLQEWHKLKGNAATIHVLIKALQDAELQHVVDSLKDKYPVSTQGQVQTARGETDQVLVLSLTGEITRLTQEKEKAQKQQKLEIQQLQECNKATEAEIEELKAEITKLSNQLAEIPELRDEVRKLRDKDGASQKLLSGQRQEMQQLKDIIKTRNEAIEEKDRALREKDRALREKDMALREKDRALREK
uniref:Death domain-containing protein n=1 Tax=Branchiostoma floridae TaxID=7739 RepID=C3YWZ1_BRAFL|eukprot:XP_002599373.1 hypothetical protein BRAFLDRAFT_64269 [Branchiostoma floridae]